MLRDQFYMICNMNSLWQTRLQCYPRHEYSNGVAYSNVNMTSIDSGVETGNDSNDSSIVQHESPHAATIQLGRSVTKVVATAAKNQTENQESVSNTLHYASIRNRIEFKPVWSTGLHFPFPLRSVIENNNFNENSQDSSTASTSGSMTVCTPQINETLFSGACNQKIESSIFQFRLSEMYDANRTMDILNEKSGYRNKIKPRRNILTWKDWRSPHIERKMRLAAATNNTMLMERLLSTGISPNNYDEHGRTPLHHASCRGYTEMVRMLLEHGANPNLRDCVGNTPLHLAAVTSKISVVTLLLTAGTNVLSLDEHGYNPLQLAQTRLKMLQNCNDSDMMKVKEEMHNVVSMLLVYLQKQKSSQEQIETLSNFCSRLSLSNTSDQVQDDVKDLLANIDALSITS